MLAGEARVGLVLARRGGPDGHRDLVLARALGQDGVRPSTWSVSQAGRPASTIVPRASVGDPGQHDRVLGVEVGHHGRERAVDAGVAERLGGRPQP